MCVHVCALVHVHVHMYVRAGVRMCACVSACMCLHMCVCAHMCACARVLACVCVHKRAHMCARAHVRARAGVCRGFVRETPPRVGPEAGCCGRHGGTEARLPFSALCSCQGLGHGMCSTWAHQSQHLTLSWSLQTMSGDCLSFFMKLKRTCFV